MKFTKTFQFEQDVDAIFKAYTNSDFLQKKMEAMGARNIDIEIETKKDEIVIQVTREMPAEVPSILKKFLNPWNKMIQKEIWTGEKGGPYYGNLEIEVEGAPVNVKGEMKLAATDSGSIAANITEISTSIPFIGKSIKKFVANASQEAIDQEFEYVKTFA